MNKIKFFLIATIFLLNSCQGVKDALEGKRRSKSGDEFLVEKKNPLTIPPNFEDLPEPVDSAEENNVSETENEDDLQKIIDQTEDSSNQEINISGSLEGLILEEINRN
tara:strand:+ start:17 stop:340 length:324 start_codon:yes stop_codon:yes gene_type:complete